MIAVSGSSRESACLRLAIINTDSRPCQGLGNCRSRSLTDASLTMYRANLAISEETPAQGKDTKRGSIEARFSKPAETARMNVVSSHPILSFLWSTIAARSSPFTVRSRDRTIKLDGTMFLRVHDTSDRRTGAIRPFPLRVETRERNAPGSAEVT